MTSSDRARAAGLIVACLEAEGCWWVLSVPSLVEVAIDYRENLRLTEHLGMLSGSG